MKNFKSIWGDGEEITLQTIDSLKEGGNWLDLAAGDGRYVKQLIHKADFLTLADIKPEDATHVLNYLPKKDKDKVRVVFVDITKTFPFNNEEFDGIFCTGTLHLFSESQLEHIFTEIDRVLKPNGKLIIDFATQITRTYRDGRVETADNHLTYSTERAIAILSDYLKRYDINMQTSNYTDDVSNIGEHGYKAIGEFILVDGTKSNKEDTQ